MSLSKIAINLKASPTLAMNEAARVLKEKGEAVIHLGAGEPKTKVPFEAVVSGAAKLTTAEIRYTPTKGIPAMLKAIINYTKENYHKTIGANNIVVSNGAKHSIYNIMITLLDPGDEVIIVAPYWVSYPDIVKMVHGVPVIVTPEDNGFCPKIDEITKKVSSKTKAILLNSPNNPSGVVYPEDLIREVVEFCEEKGIYLIMDDIYHKLVYDGKTAPSCYNFSKKDINSSYIIVINGVSKLYAMTGFRVGWTIASEEVTKAMINVQGQNSTCVSVVLQAAAAGALNGPQSGVKNLQVTLENHRNVMMKELDAFEGVKTVKPNGTFYVMPDFSYYEKDSIKLANFLLEKAKVVTVPGVEFGIEGHIRMSICGSLKDIIEGVARIKWALDPNSPKEIYIGDKLVTRDWN